MAELLVMAQDRTHTEPRKDAWCYKRGDVVAVFEDGHEWGKEEQPPFPYFEIVKVPGVPAAKFQPYMAQGLAQRRLLAVDIDTVPKRAVVEAEITAAKVTKPVVPEPVIVLPVDDPPVETKG